MSERFDEKYARDKWIGLTKGWGECRKQKNSCNL